MSLSNVPPKADLELTKILDLLSYSYLDLIFSVFHTTKQTGQQGCQMMQSTYTKLYIFWCDHNTIMSYYIYPLISLFTELCINAFFRGTIFKNIYLPVAFICHFRCLIVPHVQSIIISSHSLSLRIYWLECYTLDNIY